MLDLFGWDVGMGAAAALLLVFGAIVIGAISHFVGRVAVGYEWAVTGLAALVGGYVGSEALGQVSTWGPAYDGLYIVPALIGAVVLGAFVDALVRYATHGTYAPEPSPF